MNKNENLVDYIMILACLPLKMLVKNTGMVIVCKQSNQSSHNSQISDLELHSPNLSYPCHFHLLACD